MLAEPKRRTVWSLNPRGKYWSEDKTKIGQKLLESMGWKEGLGLGKHNNGVKQHIRLHPNSDNKGIEIVIDGQPFKCFLSKGFGYKPNSDNVWVEKNEDYEQLLANLAVHHNNSCNKSEVKVSNLEDTSRKLRNRLHYSKFIKAKNLSQCSEKDLISIIPKKLQNKETKCAKQMTENNCTEEVENSDNTFESTTNINDYFKSKMDKLKLKFTLNKIDSTKVGDNYTEEHEATDEKDNLLVEDNTSKSKKRQLQELSESSDNSFFNSNNDFNCDQNKEKKSKKIKRNKEEKMNQNSNLVFNEGFECKPTEQKVTKRERKVKRKGKELNTEESEEISSQSSNDCSKKSNKKVKFNVEKYLTIVPRGYNSNAMSVTESLKNHHKICAAIGRDKALSTTNLITLKGYGCHS